MGHQAHCSKERVSQSPAKKTIRLKSYQSQHDVFTLRNCMFGILFAFLYLGMVALTADNAGSRDLRRLAPGAKASPRKKKSHSVEQRKKDYKKQQSRWQKIKGRMPSMQNCS